MILKVLTDTKNINWLRYILHEFKRISLAKFDIEIASIQGSDPVKFPSLFYCSEFTGSGIVLPNKSKNIPSGETTFVDEGVFVFNNTQADDPRFSIEYDLLWNSFIVLSRYEEYHHEAQIQSYLSRHPRKDKSTFGFPVINYFFNKLEQLISAEYPELNFGDAGEAIIELSHDVDYIQKTGALRIKQTGFNILNLIKTISRPSGTLPQAKKTFNFVFSNPSLWCFDYWAELEKSMGMRSVFYVYASAGGKGLKSKLLDPQYDISTNTKLTAKLNKLLKEGFEVGLHGSFFSAEEPDLLKREKLILEDAIGTEATRIRQHWLRYDERKTPYFHNELFKFDSTLGWNDSIGFRNGCASMFVPYDHKNEKPFDYFIIPQVIMDSNIFDYAFKNLEEAISGSIQLLETVKKLKNCHVAISWHQRVCSPDYNWHKLYERILREYL